MQYCAETEIYICSKILGMVKIKQISEINLKIIERKGVAVSYIQFVALL